MALQRLHHLSLKTKVCFAAIAAGSVAAAATAVAGSQHVVLCQPQGGHKDSLEYIKVSFSNTVSSGLSAASYIKESVQNTGIVRFGRAALVVISVIIDYKYLSWANDPKSEAFKHQKSECHLRSAIKLRDLCCVNGGIFIKVGQHLGTLDYLLPEEYVKTMKILHTDAPQSSFENVVAVVEEEYNAKFDELFVSFSEKPVGSASLAQVHKAELKDGRVVALKVQHKNVQSHSLIDTATLEFLVSVVKKVFPDFQFNWLIEEIKRNLPLELDFYNEGKNCEMLGRILNKFQYLKVPKIHWDLTTRRLLAMEFCEGGRIDDLEFIEKYDIPKAELATKLGRIYSEMIFVKGFVHCDPHPGNILVSKNKYGETELTMLDHGLYQTLTDDFRIKYCKYWQALLRADIDAMKELGESLGVGDMHGLFACIISARSWNAITSGIDKTSLSKTEMQEIQHFAVTYIPEITEVLNRVPRQMILLLKTNDLLRGIASSLSTPQSFVALSKCCVRAVRDHDLANCDNRACWLRTYIQAGYEEIRISLYQSSLSPFGQTVLKFLSAITFPFLYLFTSVRGVF